MIKIKLNGKEYADIQEIQHIGGEELGAFLKEWFDDAPYVVGHTSGSTGIPKELRLYKSDMIASARMTNAFMGIGADAVLLLCLSVNYIAGKMMVVRALEAGADLLIAKVTASPIRELQQKVDLAAMVPMQVETTLNDPDAVRKLGYIRRLLIGGAPVSSLLESRLKNFPTLCYATYGMTETVSHVALRSLNIEDTYFALGEVHFSVDVRGCLIIDAPHLQAGRFVTNDLVRLEDSRHFKWLGRYDNVINSGGLKFFPESIESRIASRINSGFFITSCPDARLGQRLILVIEGTSWAPEAVEILRQAMHTLLSPYEIPKEILFCPQFRRTSSGKIIRTIQGLIPGF